MVLQDCHGLEFERKSVFECRSPQQHSVAQSYTEVILSP